MRQRASSPRWSHLLFLALVLSFLLSACGGATNSQSSNQAATPAGQTIAPLAMTTYQSKVLSISYPKDWQKVVVGDNVTFTSTQTGYFTIEVLPNPDGLTPVSTGVNGSVSGLKTTYPDHFTQEPVPDSTTINGIKWTQSGLTGSSTAKGTTHTIKAIVLGTNHPANAANTEMFLVIYTADVSAFDQLVAAAFQPMLSSLKLTN